MPNFDKFNPRTHTNKDSKPNALKNHLVAASGEFVGTFMFLYFAYAGHLMIVNQTAETALSNSANSSQTVIFIGLAYGMSLLVTAWGFYRISGGLFNPAVCSPKPSSCRQELMQNRSRSAWSSPARCPQFEVSSCSRRSFWAAWLPEPLFPPCSPET